MHDEAGFLSAIREAPADDTARLVFADWLDEQDAPACKTKSAFIRLELRMAEAPEQSLNRIRWTTRLQLLAARLDPAWLAIVSHPKLEACRMSFRFECPKQWEKLAPTSAPKVRHCESCQQDVHFCDSLHEARSHAARGHCVALTLALVRQPNDLNPPAPGQSMRFTPEMIERLGRVGRPRTRLPLEVVNEPEYVLPPAPPTPQWVPSPTSEERERPNRRLKRAKGRGRNRNIQRDNWEDTE